MVTTPQKAGPGLAAAPQGPATPPEDSGPAEQPRTIGLDRAKRLFIAAVEGGSTFTLISPNLQAALTTLAACNDPAGPYLVNALSLAEDATFADAVTAATA